LYEDTRKFSLVYDPAEDPVVVAETEEMEKDVKDGCLEKEIHDPDPSDSDISDSDGDDHENLWVDEVDAEAETADVEETEPEMEPDSVSTGKGAKGKGKGKGKRGKKAKPKVFTPVDKVFFLVVETFFNALNIPRFTPASSTFCGRKSGARRPAFLFTNWWTKNIVI
jgi:hypothetical protein